MDTAARRLAEYVAEIVSEAPPFTAEERAHLSTLLRPVVVRDAA